MICTVACQEIEVVKFLGLFHLCLFLTYIYQTTKSNLSKSYIFKFGEWDFQDKRQISYHLRNDFLSLKTKRVVLTLDLDPSCYKKVKHT